MAEPTQQDNVPVNKVYKPQLVIIGVVLLLIVLVVVGVAINKTSDSDKQAQTNSKLSPKQQLSAKLTQISKEHATLMNTAVDDAIKGDDTAGIANDLDDQGDQISQVLVAKYYGADAGKTFSKAWASYVTQTLAYANASKANNKAGKSAALDKASSQFALPVSRLFSAKNPGLSENNLVGYIGPYLSGIYEVIDTKTNSKADPQATKDFTYAQKNLDTLLQYIAKQTIADPSKKL